MTNENKNVAKYARKIARAALDFYLDSEGSAIGEAKINLVYAMLQCKSDSYEFPFRNVTKATVKEFAKYGLSCEPNYDYDEVEFSGSMETSAIPRQFPSAPELIAESLDMSGGDDEYDSVWDAHFRFKEGKKTFSAEGDVDLC